MARIINCPNYADLDKYYVTAHSSNLPPARLTRELQNLPDNHLNMSFIRDLFFYKTRNYHDYAVPNEKVDSVKRELENKGYKVDIREITPPYNDIEGHKLLRVSW